MASLYFPIVGACMSQSYPKRTLIKAAAASSSAPPNVDLTPLDSAIAQFTLN
uniref:Uncharacterized protein n=1 Tax=Daucus carota subsp. sativus TaxID=79200 RepID=A0A162AIA3_DAUCS